MAKNPKRPGGNPPEAYRFKAGQSGNPGGRPKKVRTTRDAFREALERLVTATIDGQRASMTTEDALIRAHISFLTKNPGLLIRTFSWLEGQEPPVGRQEEDETLADDDLALLDELMDRRTRRVRKVEDGGANDV